jgi:hypothetical protein
MVPYSVSCTIIVSSEPSKKHNPQKLYLKFKNYLTWKNNTKRKSGVRATTYQETSIERT